MLIMVFLARRGFAVWWGRAAVIVRSPEIPLMKSDANIPAVGRSFANRLGVSDNDARDRSLYTCLCDSHAGLKSQLAHRCRQYPAQQCN
jgi:hypothetical protein